VVLVQVAVPSRGRIDRYRELAREVNELVGEINGSFGRPDWTPIVYLRRGLPRPELVALYAAADVGWVTPLRDGMNLVAKEYVACHPRGDGALVLSEFAGAAAEMGEAILVNPYDEERTSQAVERALAMPPHERGERMAALRRRVLRNDAFDWSERFVAGLRQAVAGRVQASAEGPAPLPIPEVLAAFRAARRPLVLLDYDGTLVPLCAHPREAAPPAELLAALTRLGANERLRIAVISGRSRQQLQPWLGGVPGLTLAAEHGAALRVSGTGTWELLRPTLPTDWKARVQPVLEHFVDRTPGSFVEEKDYSLVWHYRMADPDSGEWLANELVATLEDLLAETELRAVLGHKTVEVRLAWANKGAVLERLEDGRAFDFRLAAGDDRTDEDLFEALPADAWTVHVGNGPSRARYREATPAAVCRLLGEMVRAMPA
jgi:trehalose 6-phosphate synthase/phosphatase